VRSLHTWHRLSIWIFRSATVFFTSVRVASLPADKTPIFLNFMMQMLPSSCRCALLQFHVQRAHESSFHHQRLKKSLTVLAAKDVPPTNHSPLSSHLDLLSLALMWRVMMMGRVCPLLRWISVMPVELPFRTKSRTLSARPSSCTQSKRVFVLLLVRHQMFGTRCLKCLHSV